MAGLFVVVAAILILNPAIVWAILGNALIYLWTTDLELTVEHPEQVRLGQTTPWTIVVHNAEDREFHAVISYFTLDGGLYQAFEPVASEPAWYGVSDLEHEHRHRIGMELRAPPGDTRYVLHVEATRIGTWTGRVRLCQDWIRERSFTCAEDEVRVRVVR